MTRSRLNIFSKVTAPIILLCLCSSVHSAEDCRVTGVAANDTLNMRNGIGTSNAVVATLAPNESGITAFNCQYNGSTKWCLVSDRAHQRTGWVAARYLDCHETGHNTSPQASPTAAPHKMASSTLVPQAVPNPTPIGSWCQAKPYCSVDFEGNTYYFPTGWKVTAPYRDKYASGRFTTKAATVVTTRQSDGTKAYLNVVLLKRRDCNDIRYPLGTLCFEPSIDPVTAGERNILGGRFSNIGTPTYGDQYYEELDQPVTVIVKAIDNPKPIKEWSLLSIAASTAFYDGRGEHEGVEIYENAPDPEVEITADTDSTIHFKTRVTGIIYIFGKSEEDDDSKVIQSGEIEIKVQPQTQCFLIPPLDESDSPQAKQAILLRYQLPYYASTEGSAEPIYNDGTQPPISDDYVNSDEWGHGPDMQFTLAPVACSRLGRSSNTNNTIHSIRRAN